MPDLNELELFLIKNMLSEGIKTEIVTLKEMKNDDLYREWPIQESIEILKNLYLKVTGYELHNTENGGE